MGSVRKVCPSTSASTLAWPSHVILHSQGYIGKIAGYHRDNMAELVARLLAMAALWVRIQKSLKNTKLGDISKGVANTL
jgi:hypothetical protein